MSKFGESTNIFSVSVGFAKMCFLFAVLLPTTILETPDNLANSVIWNATSSP